MKSCRHKCQSGPSQSRHPQIQQTAARRTDEASFPENTEFSSDNYTRRSEEEVSPTRQTQLNEGADSTRTSMKSRHGRRSHLSDAISYVGMALLAAKVAASCGPGYPSSARLCQSTAG
ncbi:hypothetical protein CK203_088990 [Vitis vinifera]|uniref:Uncharacterized protein n=1 Tax=Vitis vinifera TaxID=29760 RepID=A0A438BQT4_VITVI|nr:hypothetical protein CK203_088990 [Vitis vinifera]